jgi:hypothetical protein
MNPLLLLPIFGLLSLFLGLLLTNIRPSPCKAQLGMVAAVVGVSLLAIFAMMSLSRLFT